MLPVRPWRIAHAIAEGTSHEATGAPCQDYAEVRQVETADGTVLLAIVCDGAGSAAHAEVGAWLAAATMFELIELHIDGGGKVEAVDRALAEAWVGQVAKEMADHAANHERRLRDYACTMLVAVVGEEQAAFIQIGDGAIVTSRAHEEDWSYVFWPQHGEFANTTNFVVSEGAEALLGHALMHERVEELALFSDGLENLVLHQATRSVHEPFFRSMMTPVRRLRDPGIDARLSSDLEAYLRSPRVCERTDDDKSLILASRWATS